MRSFAFSLAALPLLTMPLFAMPETVHAQATPAVLEAALPDSLGLHGAVRAAIADLAGTELEVAARLDARGDSSSVRVPALPRDVHDRHAAALARTRALLDTMVFGRPWGGAALVRLRAEYPGSALLDRYDAALAAREGRHDAALARYDALLRATPTDPALHLGRGDVLAALSRPADAIAAYERALELVPDDAIAYARLLAAHTDSGTLAELHAQVRRLRVRRPDSTLLRDREIELLHRLGRLAEAAAVAGERP